MMEWLNHGNNGNNVQSMCNSCAIHVHLTKLINFSRQGFHYSLKLQVQDGG